MRLAFDRFFAFTSPLPPDTQNSWQSRLYFYKDGAYVGRVFFMKEGEIIPANIEVSGHLRLHFFTTKLEGKMNVFRHESIQEIKDLFSANLFTNPKPTKLLLLLCRIANLDTDSNVLDFFSGSASTAHAVILNNKNEQSNVLHFQVQLSKKLDEQDEAFDVMIIDLSGRPCKSL